MPGRIHLRAKSTALDAIYNGGNFVTSAVPIFSELPYIVLVNNDTVQWTAIFTTKSGTTITYVLNPGAINSWPAATFNLVTAALPTGGTATNFQFFYSPVPVGSLMAVFGRGGSRVILAPAAITVQTGVALYTVPVGFKAWLLAITLQNNIVAGSNATTLWRNYSGGSPAGNDYIFPTPNGLIVPAGTTWYAGIGGNEGGTSTGNNFQIPPEGSLLLAGDVLTIKTGSSTVGNGGMTVVLELWLELL